VSVSAFVGCIIETQTNLIAMQRLPFETANSTQISKLSSPRRDDSKSRVRNSNKQDSIKPVAVVNGVRIASSEIEDLITDKKWMLISQMDSARKQALEVEINLRLLQAEAKKRRMSPAQLFVTEVHKRVKEPSVDDAKAFYDKNKEQMEVDFVQIKDKIISYLRKQQENKIGAEFAAGLRKAAHVRILINSPVEPKNPADFDQTLVAINGDRITSRDVEDALRPLIFYMQEQLYSLNKEYLDQRVNSLLLEQEAQRRNVSPRVLLETEVEAKTKEVTEPDAKAFYEQNKDRFPREYSVLKELIISLLQDEARRNAESSFVSQLRSKALIQTFLAEPLPPNYDIAVTDRPWRGALQAKITISVFLDYEDENCAEAEPVLERLLGEFGGKIKLVVHSAPAEDSPFSFQAAEAAEAAEDQGKFWEFISIMLRNQKALTAKDLKAYADQLDLNRAKFDDDLNSRKYASKVQRDVFESRKLFIRAIPTFFVNQIRVKEESYFVNGRFDPESASALLKAHINEALKANKR